MKLCEPISMQSNVKWLAKSLEAGTGNKLLLLCKIKAVT